MRSICSFSNARGAIGLPAGNRGEAIPDCWPTRRMTQKRPNSITGKLGYYAMAGETSISAGTWEAACAAADTALTGAAAS